MVRARLPCFVLALLALPLLGGAAAALPLTTQIYDPCAAAMTQAERAKGIPAHLLRAIGFGESGRWDPDRRAKVAWPWTINVEGEGHFFPTKAAAIAAVRAYQAKGHRSIDVGCMQINLVHHGIAFADLEEAFDPQHNVAYAASFLTDLKTANRSWTLAVGFYHSASPQFNQPYRVKILEIWRGLRAEAGEPRGAVTPDQLPPTEPVQRLYGVHPFVAFAPGGVAGRAPINAVYAGAPAATNAAAGQRNLDLAAYRRVPIRNAAPQPPTLAAGTPATSAARPANSLTSRVN
jgi:hypothetical protein